MTPPAIELLLPDGLAAAAVADTLAAQLPVVTQRAHTIERTFWDTFDGRLHGAGLVLAAGGGRLILTGAPGGGEQAASELPRAAKRLLLGDLPPGPLRERVAAIIEMRALMPVVRVRSRFLPVNVLDDVGKIVVRLRAEEPAAVVGADRRPLPARLHVAGVLGYDGDFERVRALLAGDLGMAQAQRSVQDDAAIAVGGVPGGTSSKLKVKLRAGERADAAAVRICRRLLDVIEANLPGTLDDVDSEFLHDLRVAVRRTRALQRELAGVFPREPLRAFRGGFRQLQAITGPTRDLDVQLLEYDDLVADLPQTEAGNVAPLRGLLETHLRSARATMVAELRSAPTRALLDDWAQFLGALVERDEADRPDAARPVVDVASERITAVYRRMVKMGRSIDDDGPAEALHDLRKKGKELRYLLEFFATLYPPEVVKPMVASLKGLQDVLGRFQDREVQADLLRSLGNEVAALDGGAPAVMAMGVLAQHLVADQAAARAEFGESFAVFAAKEQRALVKQTFG